MLDARARDREGEATGRGAGTENHQGATLPQAVMCLFGRGGQVGGIGGGVGQMGVAYAEEEARTRETEGEVEVALGDGMAFGVSVN